MIVCYCFGYSEFDIKDDFIRNKGKSVILEKVIKAKKQGLCRCRETNPKGR